MFFVSSPPPLALLTQMKRKHLPPSKNHGDVMFRLAVRLRVRVAGEFPVCVSTPFRILSKQSITAGRPEPKRKRNPAPTKPFVAPLSQAALDMVATLAAAASSLPPPAVVAATTSAVATPATAPAAPVRRSSRPVRAAALAAAVRVAKRAHDEMDDGDDHDETAAAVTSAGRSTSDASAWSAGDSAPSACSFAAEEAEVLEAAKASLPRPSHGRFRFLPDEDHDDEEEEDDDDEEDEAGIALAGGDAAVGMPRGWSHGSVKDAASSCTTAGARTPLSDTISVEHVEWAADSAFGELPVTGEIASSAFSSSSSSSSSAAAAAAAAFSASSLELPASRRCRILSDAAIMAASASGRFGSFDADEAPDLSHSPLAVAPGASPQLVPSAMFASALAYGAGDLVLPQPAQAFATTLRAALVPIAPHDGQHPSLAGA
jgi:hypothetical protein